MLLWLSCFHIELLFHLYVILTHTRSRLTVVRLVLIQKIRFLDNLSKNISAIIELGIGGSFTILKSLAISALHIKELEERG